MDKTKTITACSSTEDLTAQFVGTLGVAKNSLRAYSDAFRVLRCFLEGAGLGAMDVDRGTLEEYRIWLTDNYSYSTAKQYYSHCLRFYNWLYASERPCDNPAHGLRGMPDPSETTSKILTATEADCVLEVALGSGKKLVELRNHAIVSLMLNCSLRPSQIHEADTEDLAAGDGRVLMRVRRWGGDSKDTVLEVDDSTADAVFNYAVAARVVGRPGPLFISLSNRTRGSRMSERSVRQVVSSITSSCGCEGASAYSLRISSVVRAIDSGASLGEAQGMALDRNIKVLFKASNTWAEIKVKSTR